MKTCNECKYAEWERTKLGRLHPNKQGKCTFPPPRVPALPPAFYWSTFSRPEPKGGHITRGREMHEHCAYWTRKGPKS